MLDFGEAVRRYYGNYLNAEGRAQRSAYWWVVLYQVIIYGVLFTILLMSDGGFGFLNELVEFSSGDVDSFSNDDFNIGSSGIVALVFMVIFAILNFLPDIMLNIRRFHDLNQTGWLVLVFMVVGALPVIGTAAGIGNLIWFMMPGTEGPNKYGADPLGQDHDIFS